MHHPERDARRARRTGSPTAAPRPPEGGSSAADQTAPSASEATARNSPYIHCATTAKRFLTNARARAAGTRTASSAGPSAGPACDLFGMCAMIVQRILQSPRGRATLNPDAEPSRKERGHRGVRPRHLKRRAFAGPTSRVPQAAWNRVDFVPASPPRAPRPRPPHSSPPRPPRGLAAPPAPRGYTGRAETPRGRQASTRSVRAGGGESRSRAAS